MTLLSTDGCAPCRAINTHSKHQSPRAVSDMLGLLLRQKSCAVPVWSSMGRMVWGKDIRTHNGHTGSAHRQHSGGNAKQTCVNRTSLALPMDGRVEYSSATPMRVHCKDVTRRYHLRLECARQSCSKSESYFEAQLAGSLQVCVNKAAALKRIGSGTREE